MRKPFPPIIILMAFAFVSCNKSTPAGFWKNYNKGYLLKSISDQGPFGGHRAIYWKSGKANTFNSIGVLDFAKENGWKIIDSSYFTAEQTNKWTYNNKAVFPLTSNGFPDTLMNNTELEYFPLWFPEQIKVYKFETGWITKEPGTDSTITENGFVVISSNGSEMAIYHLWGE
jgi:hypothetical protein